MVKAKITQRRVLSAPLPDGPQWMQPVDICIICPAYPGADHRYGGQFVQARVQTYRAAGLFCVVVVSRAEMTKDTVEIVNGVPVWRTGPARLDRYLRKGLNRRAVLHHPDGENWRVLSKYNERLRPLAIFHGYEARPWRTLESSYSAEEITQLSVQLDVRDVARRETIQSIFNAASATPVFVSQTLREVAESFAGIPAPEHTRIIHNPVPPADFPYSPKAEKDRYNILWVRSFQSHNYANDLARDAVLALTKRADFARFKITVCGAGKLWDEATRPLHPFTNIIRKRGFADRDAMMELHREHGIMLVPSRWESQGLTMCEAMGSGLVPITTSVAAVPEFISDQEGRVCPPENAQALASAIGELADDPALFMRLSKAAHRRATEQFGLAATVAQEIELLKR